MIAVAPCLKLILFVSDNGLSLFCHTDFSGIPLWLPDVLLCSQSAVEFCENQMPLVRAKEIASPAKHSFGNLKCFFVFLSQKMCHWQLCSLFLFFSVDRVWRMEAWRMMNSSLSITAYRKVMLAWGESRLFECNRYIYRFTYIAFVESSSSKFLLVQATKQEPKSTCARGLAFFVLCLLVFFEPHEIATDQLLTYFFELFHTFFELEHWLLKLRTSHETFFGFL